MLSWAFLALALFSSAHAHMRFVCPRPESANSGIKSGPCSDENNAFEKSYVDITPGPLTLRFEETINHKGAPLRLTLNKYGDKENICMLLDQYPHNENGTMNIGDACWPFGWPLGGCITQHYVTVNIPDIKCDKCFLQLVSVMTDKYTDAELPCHQVDQGTNNCSSYFSCANVKIRPTEAGKDQDISTCTDYKSNLVGDWPYKPMDMFQSEMDGTQKMKAEAEFDVLDGTLLVTLPTVVTTMANQLLVFLHGEKELGSAAVSGQTVEWAVPKEHQPLLRENAVTLSLKDSSKTNEMARGTLELTDKKFERDYYRRHGKDLTPAGWLQEAEFVGAGATYPFAMQPHGSCVLDTKYYGASKVDSTVGYGSALSLTLTDLHAWVRGTSSRSMIGVSFYAADGSVESVAVPKAFFSADGNHFDGILDMKSVVRGGKGKFFDKVKVTLGPENDKLEVSMPLSEATVAPIKSNGKRVGEAVVEVKSQAKLACAGVVSFPSGSTQKVVGLSVHGPARSNAGGEQLASFSVSTSGSAAYGSGLTTSSFSLAGLDALHAGQVYVNFKTEGAEATDRPISGQLPARKECKSSDNTCLTAKLSFGGGNVNRYLEKLETNGYATFKRSSSAVEYKITLRDVQRGETVDRVQVEDSKDNSLVLHSGAFTASTLEDNVQTLTKTLSNPPSWLTESLGKGELTIRVYTSVYVIEPIFGTLPAISTVN